MSKILTVFLIGILIGLLIDVLLEFSGDDLSEDYQATIIAIYDSIDIGDTQESTISKIVLNKHNDQRIITNSNSSDGLTIRIVEPRDFLSAAWVLSVCFNRGVVVGYRVGMLDDFNVVPEGAPEGKGICN